MKLISDLLQIDYNNRLNIDQVFNILENDNNIIIGEIYINENNINKDIQIINSYENLKTEYFIDKEDDYKYENEKEIKENIEIKINKKLIGFSYTYRFEKEGQYKIEYLFKNNLTKTNHMFCGCEKLTNLNLSNFNTQNVTNMSKMFSHCHFLIDLNLTSFNTQNVTNMSEMFFECRSLTNLNLSNFNTQKVNNIYKMFAYCESLTDLNLSNFNTKNVTNMSSMFYNCKILKNLNLSNFTTQNVVDMRYMFCDCYLLTNLVLSNFKVTNLELSNFKVTHRKDDNMFSFCSS